MRRVRLAGTTLDASVVGFGCAPLMSRLGRRESLRKLEVAYELGITHFDAARSYGFGAVEGMLGDFIASRRDAVTVTTKLGIAPARRTRGRALAKAVARKVVGLSPRLRRAVRRRAVDSLTPGQFGVEEARASLETSLRELKIECIDVLLLHECHEHDLRSDELLQFLEAAREQGKVRYFGIATDTDSTVEILRTRPAYAGVVQLPNSVVERNLERLPSNGDRPLLTHSAIRAGMQGIQGHLAAASDRAVAWSKALGADCSDPEVLSGLMLAYAVRANPAGIVLFGSQSEDHIRATVTAIAEQRFSADQVDRFADLVERDSLREP